MKKQLLIMCLPLVAILFVVGISTGQRGRQPPPSFDTTVHRNGVPSWEKDANFKHDVFTFVRVRYNSYNDNWRRGKWSTDFPDSDLNFSFRLQELTSFKVDPNGKILSLTDKELFDYPFLYIIEPGDMWLSEDEVAALRRYCLNGGFVMVDDFWGEREWYNFEQQMKRVFPKRELTELPLEHEIFNNVYKLSKKPQIPSINTYWNGRTSERPDADTPHYKALFDDKERIMMIVCHNTDLGDGWEREGMDPSYFKEFSEKWSYPLGINIVTYAMTH